MSAPTTRVKTVLDGDCWMKRVASPERIEKPCQLMIEPGEFVMLSVVALGRCMLTAPFTTWAPVGLPNADETAKQLPTVAASGRRINGFLMGFPAAAAMV